MSATFGRALRKLNSADNSFLDGYLEAPASLFK